MGSCIASGLASRHVYTAPLHTHVCKPPHSAQTKKSLAYEATVPRARILRRVYIVHPRSRHVFSPIYMQATPCYAVPTRTQTNKASPTRLHTAHKIPSHPDYRLPEISNPLMSMFISHITHKQSQPCPSCPPGYSSAGTCKATGHTTTKLTHRRHGAAFVWPSIRG
jgi:hypothetical protein